MLTLSKCMADPGTEKQDSQAEASRVAMSHINVCNKVGSRGRAT